MTQDQAVSLMNQMLWQCMVIAAPVLVAILIVGLIISIIQATTQLQEMTLSYVPKMFVAGIILMMLGPWMIGRLVQFAFQTISMIPSLE